MNEYIMLYNIEMSEFKPCVEQFMIVDLGQFHYLIKE